MTNFLDANLTHYVIHRIAESESGYNYYLYIHPRGQAIIMRETTDGTELSYADGGLGISKWTARASQEYMTYDKLVK